jgi:glycosyltransferase involved in cell wall biosynthesis
VTVAYRPSAGELARLYQAADLLVLPSVGEGFPLVIQEAMACGTPALVGDEAAAACPQAAEVVMAERVGAPDTVTRWTARIEALLASPASLEAMRPRVAAFARDNWSWTQCVERYAKVLRSCLAAR